MTENTGLIKAETIRQWDAAESNEKRVQVMAFGKCSSLFDYALRRSVLWWTSTALQLVDVTVST